MHFESPDLISRIICTFFHLNVYCSWRRFYSVCVALLSFKLWYIFPTCNINLRLVWWITLYFIVPIAYSKNKHNNSASLQCSIFILIAIILQQYFTWLSDRFPLRAPWSGKEMACWRCCCYSPDPGGKKSNQIQTTRAELWRSVKLSHPEPFVYAWYFMETFKNSYTEGGLRERKSFGNKLQTTVDVNDLEKKRAYKLIK